MCIGTSIRQYLSFADDQCPLATHPAAGLALTGSRSYAIMVPTNCLNNHSNVFHLLQRGVVSSRNAQRALHSEVLRHVSAYARLST